MLQVQRMKTGHTSTRSPWPERLWLIRHGESAGNVARDAAYAQGLSRIAIEGRDVDVPLSPCGVEQAQAIGHWFGALAPNERPEAILSSPYARSRRTAELICEDERWDGRAPSLIVDERLREREFGILDRLTRAGIEELYPEQAEIRRVVGKFYYRPPGGESWCDVILRMRSVLDTLSLHYAGVRVLIVTHQVVVLCLRYLLETLDETRLLEIDRAGDVINCGVTEYSYDPDNKHGESRMHLERYNCTVALIREGAPVTAAPDVSGAAR
jgi:probable phosphoglycerate mutase